MVKTNRKTFALASALIAGFLLIALAASAQDGKSLVLKLNYGNVQNTERLNIIEAYEMNASPVSYSGTAYRADIVSTSGELLKTVGFDIPESPAGFKGHVNETQGTASGFNFTLSLPYFANIGTIGIYDKSGRKMISVLVKEPELNSGQLPDSAKKPATAVLINYNWAYISGPIALILGLLAYIEVKRKKDHARLMIKQRNNNAEALKNYVEKYIKKGYSKEQIRNALIKYNYNNQEIEEAFKGIK